MLPQEKLQTLGVTSLTTAELFAIMLGSGSAKENVFELSERITSQPGFRKSLLDQQVEYWTKIPGIGPTKASRLVAGIELSKRMMFEKETVLKIQQAKDVFEILRHQIVGQANESFFVICLSTKNEILLIKKIHHGFCNQVITDMKILFSTILQTGALSFICAHNHPSGDVSPSKDDKELTSKISSAAKLLDLNFLDHVIVSTNAHYSFSDNEPGLFTS